MMRCRECLDRRRAKKESKEKARVLRETAKLERDAKRLHEKQRKEELLAKKSAEAIEHKAKRVLEMQDRILSRKKIKYKDKEEETLGRLAEDLAQTVRSAKERLEKLEKEDAALRKKVRRLRFPPLPKARGLILIFISHVPGETGGSAQQETARRGRAAEGRGDALGEAHVRALRSAPLARALVLTLCPLCSPTECVFGDIPAKLTGQVLSVWDSIYSFCEMLQLSPISVDQFGAMLSHKEYCVMLTEIHMSLLELVLEDRLVFRRLHKPQRDRAADLMCYS